MESGNPDMTETAEKEKKLIDLQTSEIESSRAGPNPLVTKRCSRQSRDRLSGARDKYEMVTRQT